MLQQLQRSILQFIETVIMMKTNFFYVCIALSAIYCINFVTSEVLPYSGDCKKYQVCDTSGCFVFNCGEGTEFNPKISVCDFPLADRKSCSTFDYSGSIKLTPGNQDHQGSYQQTENTDSNTDSDSEDPSDCNNGSCHSQSWNESPSKCNAGKGGSCNNGAGSARPVKYGNNDSSYQMHHGSGSSYTGNHGYDHSSSVNRGSTICSQGKGGPCNQVSSNTYPGKQNNLGISQQGNHDPINSYPGSHVIGNQDSNDPHVIREGNPGGTYMLPSHSTFTGGNHNQANSYVLKQSGGNPKPTNSYPGGQGSIVSFQDHQAASNSHTGNPQSSNQGHSNPFLGKQVASNTFSMNQGHSSLHSGIQGTGSLGISACSEGKGPCKSPSTNGSPHNSYPGQQLSGIVEVGIKDSGYSQSKNQGHSPCSQGKGPCNSQLGIQGPPNSQVDKPRKTVTFLGVEITDTEDPELITPVLEGPSGPIRAYNSPFASHSAQGPINTETHVGSVLPQPFPGRHDSLNLHGTQSSTQAHANSYSGTVSMASSNSVNRTPFNSYSSNQSQDVQRNEHPDNLFQQKQLGAPHNLKTGC